MSRNLNDEFQDSEDRKYAYDIDYIMHDYMIKEFQPYFNGNALEMGCYKGEFTKKLQIHFDDITVLEGSSDLINEAQKSIGGEVTFIHSMFETAEFDNKFDSIFLMHTLEHLDAAAPVLQKINNWLSDDGTLFLAVPNAYAASRQIAVKMGLIESPTSVTQGEREHGHRCTYDIETLKKDVLAAGLNIKKDGGVFFKPFANFQFDKLMQAKIVDQAYLDGCYELGKEYPDLCASIYLLCGKG